jgi:hypothetical protein
LLPGVALGSWCETYLGPPSPDIRPAQHYPFRAKMI